MTPTVANGRVYLPTFSYDDPTNTIPVPLEYQPYIRAYGLNGKCTMLNGTGNCCDDFTVCCAGGAPPCFNE